MPKFLLTALLTIPVFLSVSCGGSDDAGVEDPASQSTSASSNRTPTQATNAGSELLEIGKVATLKDGTTVRVIAVELPVAINHTIEAGRRVMGFDTELCAGVEGVQSTGFSFAIRLADNTTASPYLGEKDPKYINSLLGKGECNRGWVTFSLPETVEPASITFNDPKRGTARWSISR